MGTLKGKLRRIIKRLRGRLKVKRIQRRLLYLSGGLVIMLLASSLTMSTSHNNGLASNLEARQTAILRLSKALQAVKQQKAETEQEVKAKAESEAKLQAQIDELNKQLQAKAAKQSLLARATFTARASAASPAPSVGNCGDNMYKQYIYQHESGCNTNRWNSSGCYGIGQACPASKIAHCGADFACQDAWFSSYAISRYGSWAGAYSAWQRQGWW